MFSVLKSFTTATHSLRVYMQLSELLPLNLYVATPSIHSSRYRSQLIVL